MEAHMNNNKIQHVDCMIYTEGFVGANCTQSTLVCMFRRLYVNDYLVRFFFNFYIVITHDLDLDLTNS